MKTGNHLRVVVLFVLCLALLAGWGLDELAAQESRHRNAVLAVIGALLVVPLLGFAVGGHLSAGQLTAGVKIAWGFSWPSSPPSVDAIAAIRMSSLVVWLTFMGLAALLVAARVLGRLPVATFVVLALLLVAADLFKAGMGATPAIPTSHATQPDTPGLEYLRLAAARTASSESSASSAPRRWFPTCPCAGTCTTPAATTCPWRSATTPCGGPR